MFAPGPTFSGYSFKIMIIMRFLYPANMINLSPRMSFRRLWSLNNFVGYQIRRILTFNLSLRIRFEYLILTDDFRKETTTSSPQNQVEPFQ